MCHKSQIDKNEQQESNEIQALNIRDLLLLYTDQKLSNRQES